MILNFKVQKNTDLKTFLSDNRLSKKTISKLLLEKKNIFINGTVYKDYFSLVKGDEVMIIIEDEASSINKIDKDIDVIYEDEFFLVVNKPKNLSTIPSRAHFDDNLAGRVKNYFEKKNVNCGIHAVNRLDFLTCGLVIFAKSNFIHQQTADIKIEKKYKCYCQGVFNEKCGQISAKIGRVDGTSVLRQVCDTGKVAKTNYRVLSDDGKNSLVDITLLTGRTHQIRVHLSHINHPLIGDTLYNENSLSTDDFYLCSYFLSFYFPFNDKQYEFSI